MYAENILLFRIFEVYAGNIYLIRIFEHRQEIVTEHSVLLCDIFKLSFFMAMIIIRFIH